MTTDDKSSGGNGPTSPGGGATGQCIEALWHEHQGALFGYCLKLIDDVDVANDMVQETFCEALRDWEREAVRNPKAWLFRLARNNCRDYLKRGSTSEIPLSAFDDYGDEHVPPFLHTDGTENAAIEAVAVSEALACCTTGQQRYLRWVYVEGYDCREIAGHLGIEHQSARQALMRARNAFKQAYAAQSA